MSLTAHTLLILLSVIFAVAAAVPWTRSTSALAVSLALFEMSFLLA